MFWGVSKRFGGFRIGVGGRVGGSRRSGPTQREQAAQEKYAFLVGIQNRLITAQEDLLLSYGHLPEDSPEDVLALISGPIEESNRIRRLVHDGAPLTDRRRTTLLESVYAVEEARLRPAHPLLKLYEKQVNAVLYWWGGLVATLVMALGWYFMGKHWIFPTLFIMGCGITAFLTYLWFMRTSALRMCLKQRPPYPASWGNGGQE